MFNIIKLHSHPSSLLGFYSNLFSNRTKTSPSGLLICIDRQSNSFPIQVSLNLRTAWKVNIIFLKLIKYLNFFGNLECILTLMINNCIFCSANLRAMQVRGPCPKGSTKYGWISWCWHSRSHLSGINTSGSGKYSGSRHVTWFWVTTIVCKMSKVWSILLLTAYDCRWVLSNGSHIWYLLRLAHESATELHL